MAQSYSPCGANVHPDVAHTVHPCPQTKRYLNQFSHFSHSSRQYVLRSLLALAAFLAFVGGSTLLLQEEILGGSQLLPDDLVECLRGRWVALYGPAPLCQLASKQSSWNRPGLLVDSAALELSLKHCRFNGRVSLQHKRHTAATGFGTVDYGLKTRPSILLSCWGWALNSGVHTLAAMAVWLMPQSNTIQNQSVTRRLVQAKKPESEARSATGVRGLVCKQAPSRVVRHYARNKCIGRAFSTPGMPVRKEPAGLV